MPPQPLHIQLRVVQLSRRHIRHHARLPIRQRIPDIVYRPGPGRRDERLPSRPDIDAGPPARYADAIRELGRELVLDGDEGEQLRADAADLVRPVWAKVDERGEGVVRLAVRELEVELFEDRADGFDDVEEDDGTP